MTEHYEPQDRKQEKNYIAWLSEHFANLAVWCFDHRWIVLALTTLAMGLCIWAASTLRVDGSFEAYFDRGDPAYEAYLKFRKDFGSDENIFILYAVPDREHGVFNVEVMEKIATLTKTLEKEIPFVKEATSLTNAEMVEGVSDGIEITSWDKDYAHTQEAALILREKIVKKPLYVGGLISVDGQYAAILIDIDRKSVV